jgi:PDZ domain-containing protein
MTIHAAPKPITVASTAPRSSARALPEAAAHSRFHHGAGRYISRRERPSGDPARSSVPGRARWGSMLALAGLRHPATISTVTATPATQAAVVVISLVDTQQQIVTVPSGPRLPSSAHRWWAIPLAVLGLLAIGGVLFAAVVPSTAFVHKRRCLAAERQGDAVVCTKQTGEEGVQFATVPAGAEAVEPRMTIDGAKQYTSQGQIYFVTVRGPEMSLLDYFVVRKNPAASTQTYKEVFGDSTPDQQREEGYQMMRDAKETAEYVALSRAGIAGVSLNSGPAIIGTLCLDSKDGSCTLKAPAADLLKAGDQITAVGGTKVDVLDDLTPIMKGYQPGDTVEVAYKRGGADATATVTTIASPEDPTRTIIGFIPADTRQIHLPEDVTVQINTDNIGGPSAGTAFALTLLDELTPGSLMGSGRVAVTGTIDVDGNIGAIGGLSSKASAVEQVGVKYFLVPAAQGDADIAHAREVVGDSVTIIPVKTIDDAITELHQLGGDPLAAPAPPTTS